MANANSVGGLTQFQPRRAINQTITLKILTDNVKQTFPNFRVPYGLSVTLRARSSNAASVFVSNNPQLIDQREVTTGGISGSSIGFPVDNLGQIWVQGKAGDVVTAEISGAAIG